MHYGWDQQINLLNEPRCYANYLLLWWCNLPENHVYSTVNSTSYLQDLLYLFCFRKKIIFKDLFKKRLKTKEFEITDAKYP